MTVTVALTPHKAMLRSVVWTAISIVWLLFVSLKLQELRSGSGHVSPFRYFAVVFWVVVLAFWIVNLFRDLKRMRAEAVGRVS